MKKLIHNKPFEKPILVASSFEIISDTEKPLFYQKRLVLADVNPNKIGRGLSRYQYAIYFELTNKYGREVALDEIRDNIPEHPDSVLYRGFLTLAEAVDYFEKLCDERGLPYRSNPVPLTYARGY